MKNFCFFAKIIFFFTVLYTPVLGQEVNQNKNDYEKKYLEDKISIVPELLYQDIETKNKTDKEIINAKLKKIEKAKSDKFQKLSDPSQEQQRQQQLEFLENELIQGKNDKTNKKSKELKVN